MGLTGRHIESGKVILVVDDETRLADLIASQLEEVNYEVMQAHDGAAALELINYCTMDLVITDFMMPGMTGLDLARAIRANAKFINLPIILVSGANGSVGRNHPELFDAVLDRPYSSQRLIEQVEFVLN